MSWAGIVLFVLLAGYGAASATFDLVDAIARRRRWRSGRKVYEALCASKPYLKRLNETEAEYVARVEAEMDTQVLPSLRRWQ